MKKLNSLEIGVCVILAIGILGFIYASDISMTLGKKLIVEWLIIGIVIAKLVKNKILKTYLLYCLIISLPITPLRYNQWSFLTFWTILVYAGHFILIERNFNLTRLSWVLNTLCGIALINACWTIPQYFGIWWIVEPSLWHGGKGAFERFGFGPMAPNLCGLLANSNIAGAFYGITIVAFFRRKWWICLPVILFGLWQTNSYGGYIIVFVTTMFFMFFRYRKVFIIGTIMGVVGLAVYGFMCEFDLTKIHRFNMWKRIFTDYCMLKPWLGWGLGQFEIASQTISAICYPELVNPGRWSHAHSSVLQVLFEQGRLGLLLISTYVGSILFMVFKRFKMKGNILILTAMSIACICAAGGHWIMEDFLGILPVTVFALMAKIANDRGNI